MSQMFADTDPTANLRQSDIRDHSCDSWANFVQFWVLRFGFWVTGEGAHEARPYIGFAIIHAASRTFAVKRSGFRVSSFGFRSRRPHLRPSVKSVVKIPAGKGAHQARPYVGFAFIRGDQRESFFPGFLRRLL